MKLQRPWALLPLAGMVLARDAGAGSCPACSNPNLPIGSSSLGDAAQSTAEVRSVDEVAASVAPTREKLFVLAFTTDFVPMWSSHVAECPDLGPRCAGPSPPRAYEHHVQTYAYGAAVDAHYGLLPWLSLGLTVPYRAVTARVRYADLNGADYVPDPPDVHHRNETITGLGDPTLAASLGGTSGKLGYSVRLGTMLPLGRALDVDPFAAGRAGEAHEHIQFGAGTVRPVVGGALGYNFGRIGLDAFTQATLSVATNSTGYKAGQRIGGGVMASSSLGLARARFAVGVEAAHETTETWQGLVQEEGNLGRTDVLAVATARWSPLARWSFFSTVKTPVFVDVVGGQLTYPIVAQVGAATGWSL